MTTSLPQLIRIPLLVTGLVLNLLVHSVPLMLLTACKLLLPLPGWRRICSHGLPVIADSWCGVNNVMFDLCSPVHWQIEDVEGLRHDRSYLLLCNHQSWVDIPVLQKVFNRRIPFPRFFLKRQLAWIPLLNLAWWALDFPFVRRYSREFLERHPELKGRDREITRRACAKFRQFPVTLINFIEGTRFTPARHAAKKSSYRHLLPPRAGGLAFALDTMGDTLNAILDVTIVYPDGPCSFGDLIAGRIREIHLHVCQRPIDPSLCGDYENDDAFRERFFIWINQLWQEKDARIERMLASAAKSTH